MREIGERGKFTSILDRFKNDEVFHASQLKHNWTEMVQIFRIREDN